MRIDPDGELVLSRRNLRTLLVKLDGYPPNSACTIVGGDEAPNVRVRAEEDDAHYAERPAGHMHPTTETVLAQAARDQETIKNARSLIEFRHVEPDELRQAALMLLPLAIRADPRP